MSAVIRGCVQSLSNRQRVAAASSLGALVGDGNAVISASRAEPAQQRHTTPSARSEAISEADIPSIPDSTASVS